MSNKRERLYAIYNYFKEYGDTKYNWIIATDLDEEELDKLLIIDGFSFIANSKKLIVPFDFRSPFDTYNRIQSKHNKRAVRNEIIYTENITEAYYHELVDNTDMVEKVFQYSAREHTELIRTVRREFQKLTKKEKTRLWLHVIEEYSIREVASLCGCSKRSAEVSIKRASEKLRTACLRKAEEFDM